jgi:hypothetical protein
MGRSLVWKGKNQFVSKVMIATSFDQIPVATVGPEPTPLLFVLAKVKQLVEVYMEEGPLEYSDIFKDHWYKSKRGFAYNFFRSL